MATAKGIKNAMVKGTSKAITGIIDRFNKDKEGFFTDLADRMVKVTDSIRYETAIGAECINIIGKTNGKEKKDINAEVKEAVAPIAGGRMARYYPGVGSIIIKHKLTVNEVAGNFTAIALNVEEMLKCDDKKSVLAEIARVKGAGEASTSGKASKAGDKGAQEPKVQTYATIASNLERRIKKDAKTNGIKWSAIEKVAGIPAMSADVTEADRAEMLILNILRLATGTAIVTEIKKTA